MIEDILINLDKEKIYCQKCLLENKIIPLSISESSDYIKTECSHTGRNCNTFRFHNNEWHLFYGFLKDAKCRTCHAKKNLEKMNDPNGEIRQKLNEWYKTDKCKKF